MLDTYFYLCTQQIAGDFVFHSSRMNKFGARRTEGCGSKLEASVYEALKIKELAGLISDLKRQQTVVLQDGPQAVRITWRVDFSYVDEKTGELTYAEAKGFETADYKLKLKMWRKNPPANLVIWKGTHRSPVVVEEIFKHGGKYDNSKTGE
jgi:hypothetical protein